MSKQKNRQFSWRAFVSVLTALSFIGMTFTGVILFVVPPGRIANWTGWTILALTKHQWIALHLWFSLIFVVASAFHVQLNWKPFVSYFKNKVTKALALRAEWALALVFCVVVFLGTIADVTPFAPLAAWNESIKHSWDRPRDRGPIPHAELLTLTELAEQVRDADLETMLANLKARGIEVDSPDVVLGELAEAHNMTPARLYGIAMGRTAPGRGYGAGRGQGGRGPGGSGGGSGQRADTHADSGEKHDEGGRGRGFGRMTLKEYCDDMGLDVNTAVKKLKDAGFKADPNMTMRAIADGANVHPSQIRTLIESPTQ
jgi:hypothetical protein